MSGSTTDYQEIYIDGYKFRLSKNSKVRPAAVDRFPGKVTVGTDYSKDSNDLLSTWIISDLAGGHGITEHKEGTTDTRFRFGTLYARYPGQLVKHYGTYAQTVGAGAVMPLADLLQTSTIYRMSSSGTTLYENTTSRGSIAAVPTDKGIVFSGTAAQRMLYIPRGDNGYSVFDKSGPTVRNVSNASHLYQSFVIWDEKLIGITTAGQLKYAVTAASGADTTFTDYSTGGKLDAAFVPKHLVRYKNQAGEAAVYVVTDQNVWVFDAATPRLYMIPDLESVHPKFGQAAVVWRGSLYVAGGMDILEFNGNVVRNIGLSRDQGLPWRYSSYVTDLVAGQNAMYALVVGVTSGGSTYYSVHEYSGFGWFCIWTGIHANVPPGIMVTRAGGAYRLFWGMGATGSAFYQELPINFANPEEELNSGAANMTFGDFTSSPTTSTAIYYLETGRFDAAMKGYQKIANAVEWDLKKLADGETARIKYRLNGATAWTQLGADITAAGYQVISFGTITSDGIYPGVSFKDIEFRLEIEDDIAFPYIQSTTSVTDSIVFSFLKVMNPSWAWEVQVDLNAAHNEYSPEQMLDKLIALKNSGVFYAMKHRDDTYRIRIAQIGGAEEAGKDKRGNYTLSILEIPTKLGAPV